MKTHGHTAGGKSSLTFMSWSAMRNRCNNTSHADYPHYGARGISVCARWMDSFENFLADMGERPSRDHTLDRIDTTGGYSPENCRWATATQQMRNRKDTCVVTYRGETRCLAEWAEIVGINRYTLWKRIYQHKWDLERAMTKPPRTWKAVGAC